MSQNIEQLTVNTIRTLSIDAINKANSGHPGLPMGAAPMAYALWNNHLSHNPNKPKWFNRDRFVLSAGHGSMLLYSLLHLYGYKVTLEDLKNFRQLNSKTPGHPEVGHTDGVEATTGPLGQGIATAVGMAMAETHLASVYNKESFDIVDHYTYALCGDGDLMEGVAYEAISMAGHLKLGKLVVLYDSNDISLDGKLSVSFSEDIQKRFESAHWQYIRVNDGNNLEEINKAIELAKQNTEQPTLIEVKTTIGFGSTNAGTSKVHGSPLGKEEAKVTKSAYGWNYEEDFYVPQEVRTHLEQTVLNGVAKAEAWTKMYSDYAKAYPELADQLEEAITLKYDIPTEELHTFQTGSKVSTRNASGEAINFFAKQLPYLFGGSADLSGSTITTIKGEDKFVVDSNSGRNVYFGVREHAMGAALNGMALHGGVKPFGGTFFVFNDYLRPSIRLAALSKLPVVYVFTHDSIAVGEDGPTHEPIEQLAALRAIPGLTVIRPSDANETVSAWAYALQQKSEPVALVLSRQNLEVFEETRGNVENLSKGAYVLSDSVGTPEVILLATGSEVGLAMDSKKELEQNGISTRVVAVPSWELFQKQSPEYKESVLPTQVKNRVAIEMGISMGWERFVGTEGKIISIETFGASGPGDEVLNLFGFTVENVVKEVQELLNK